MRPSTESLSYDKHAGQKTLSDESEKVIVLSFPDSETGFQNSLSIPDGGLQAWATVVGAWLCQFCTFGYANSYGVYQDYYVRQYLDDKSSSAISWIGSVQVFFLFSLGLFSGKLFDKGYFYHLMIGGSTLFCFCLFMLSLSQPHQYYQIFLSQGLGAGIGLGMTYVPCLGVVAHHFERRRALAMGIVASGSSVGAIVHPIMLNKLFHSSVGFHHGVRASAGLNLGLLGVAVLLMRTRLPPRKTGNATPIAAFARDVPYAVTALGCLFFIFAHFFPFFFLQLDAILHGINPDLAFYLLSILNTASFFGRITSSAATNSLGVFNVIIVCTITCAIVIFSLALAQNIVGFVVFAILFGFTSGGIVAILAPMLASLANDFNEIGARIGLSFALSGVAALLGNPIAGALLSENFIWWRPIVFAGICAIVSAILLLIGRFLIAAKKGTRRV